MATKRKSVTIEDVVETTLEYIKKHALEDFKELDGTKKDELVQIIRKAAEEYLRLEEIEDLRENAEELAKHLPPHRIKMIKEGLTIPTYKLNIRKEKGTHFVDVTRDGQEFMPSRELATLADINWAKAIQYASIIVEAILLVMQAVGIHAEVSQSVIDKVAQETAEAVESSSLLQQAVQNLQKVFENSESSASEKAKAIYVLIKDSKSAGILWKIIKGLCANMSWWDWTKTAGIVSAMIIAALSTDGVALIAKIVLALNSAYEFGKKIGKLTELDSIKKSK